jgi:hypothetical protein
MFYLNIGGRTPEERREEGGGGGGEQERGREGRGGEQERGGGGEGGGESVMTSIYISMEVCINPLCRQWP